MNSDEAKGLTPDQALKLFKMYEDKGWAVKEQMLKSVTWLTPVVFGLIAFAGREYFIGPASGSITVAMWIAFFLSSFILGVIIFSLSHANDDYTLSRQVVIRNKEVFPEKNIVTKFLREDEQKSEREKKRNAFHFFRYFPYVGRQFKWIMVGAVALIVISLTAALFATVYVGLHRVE
jgi:hypothetical protein